MTKWLRRWRLCTRGQGVIEYAFILCFVALGLVLVLLLLRKSTENRYSGVRSNLDQAVGCEGSPGCSSGLGAETGSGGSTSGSTSGVGDGSGYGNTRGGIDNEGNGNGNGGGEKGK
jgi:Flp pilus assembly pilin Flp